MFKVNFIVIQLNGQDSANNSIDKDTFSIASIPYTAFFSDTVLVGLITAGIHENLDLKIAIQRINQASASFRQSKAAFLPSLDANGNVSRNKQSIAALNLPPDFVGTFL